VSPSSLRRYRAERLLRREFEGLRGDVIAAVRGRLRACGVRLDASDLEACYAEAWHGLYAAVLDGQEVVNLGGWLTLVMYRRAIEEHRRRSQGAAHGARSENALAEERDFAAELDDRMRLRQLFEGLRGRLSAREREAAALCYLQGLSRSEAAARMGVSEARMRKLMEGRGAGSPGVAGKVGTLVETIRTGGWCEEQGSLMRGFAFGILDPQGERYRLAMLHHGECPACRSYVLSLRGLAAILPPVPALLQLALGAGAGAGQGAGAATGVHGGSTLPAGSGASGGALTASGAAGAGAAGGGWLLAGGPLGAKLAVGCLLALGVGAGCVALSEYPSQGHSPARGRERARASDARASRSTVGDGLGPGRLSAAAHRSEPASSVRADVSSAAGRVSREFGPEQPAASGSRSSARSQSDPAATAARTASAASRSASAAPAAVEASTAVADRPAGAPAAQREFAPG
jgi:type IV secretion system protein TrbL